MTCDNCGSKYLETNKYKIKGKDEKGRRKQRTVKICVCCDAWGVTSNIEKMLELTDVYFDENTVVIE